MQQRFLLQFLLLAQHVSGTTMPIIRSSRVLYSGCCPWYLVLWFSSCWSGVELWVMRPVCRMLLYSKYHMQKPLCNTLELLIMGIGVPETCWASNKISNKNLFCIKLAFYFHILGNSLHWVSLDISSKLSKEVNEYLLHFNLLWNKQKVDLLYQLWHIIIPSSEEFRRNFQYLLFHSYRVYIFVITLNVRIFLNEDAFNSLKSQISICIMTRISFPSIHRLRNWDRF